MSRTKGALFTMVSERPVSKQGEPVPVRPSVSASAGSCSAALRRMGAVGRGAKPGWFDSRSSGGGSMGIALVTV